MAKQPSKPSTVECVVLRDYWDENGDRHRAGRIEEVSVEEAFDGIEKGTLKRRKDAD